MAIFEIKYTGINKLLKIKTKAESGLNNMSGVNLKAVIVLEAWVKRNIKAQGRNHDDSKFLWPPLSQMRIRQLQEKGGGSNPPMLQDTGRLISSWQRRANAKQGILKSGVIYSSTHEEGEGRIPQRKIFPTPKQGEKILTPLYRKYVRGLLK